MIVASSETKVIVADSEKAVASVEALVYAEDSSTVPVVIAQGGVEKVSDFCCSIVLLPNVAVAVLE